MTAADNWSIPYVGGEAGLAYAEVDGVRIYDARHLVPLANYAEGTVEKTGYAVHHDAIVFTGTTIAEEIARIRAIDTFHRDTNGWPGIGYHRMIAPSGRVYIVGSSSTVRAHVANLNHLWIGYCFIGNYANNRPPEPAMHAFRTVLQWETDMRKVAMRMRPHKALTPGTECPGVWAALDSWVNLVLSPRALVPPPPPTPPQPGVPVAAVRTALGLAQTHINEAIRLLGG